VLGLIKGGNSPAALAQIKVAPSVKDLRQLQAAFIAANLPARHPQLSDAIADHIDALSSPRLHRSP
jgi:hypothetical protein